MLKGIRNSELYVSWTAQELGEKCLNPAYCVTVGQNPIGIFPARADQLWNSEKALRSDALFLERDFGTGS